MGSKVYGQATASSSNVVFPFDQAAGASSALWDIADRVKGMVTSLDGLQRHAVADWTGPDRRVFDRNVDTWNTSAANVAGGLQHLAEEIARAWAAARGQQDRINAARWAAEEQRKDDEDEGLIERGWEWAFGETNEYPVPDDPPTPGPPSFRPTRDPVHPEFGF